MKGHLAKALVCVLLLLITACGNDSPKSPDDRQTPTPGGTVAPTFDVSAALGEDPDASQRAAQLMQIQEPTRTEECMVDPKTPGLMTPDEFKESLPCVVSLFPWPASRQMDMELYAQLAFGDDADQWRFPPDYRFTTIETFNQCAWFSTWLEAVERGDADTQEAAELVIVYVIPAYPETIPGYPADLDSPDWRGFIIEIGKSVQLGDPSVLQQWMPGTCPLSPWASPEAIVYYVRRED